VCKTSEEQAEWLDRAAKSSLEAATVLPEPAEHDQQAEWLGKTAKPSLQAAAILPEPAEHDQQVLIGAIRYTASPKQLLWARQACTRQRVHRDLL
jgi:hypothetical protein